MKAAARVVIIILLLLLVIFLAVTSIPRILELMRSDEDPGITLTYYLTETQDPVRVSVSGSAWQLETLPTREGYRFGGLFTSWNGEGTRIINEAGMCDVAITQPMTLFCYWLPNSYILYFDAGEGVLPEGENAVTVEYGSQLTSFPLPEREGYNFKAWVNRDGVALSNGTSILPTYVLFTTKHYPIEDNMVILRASYEWKKYTVTFSYMEPGYADTTTSVGHGSSLSAEQFPTADTGSREIIGWSAVMGGTEPFTGIVTGDMTLYAIWRNYRTVTLDGGEGMTPVQVRLDQDTSLTPTDYNEQFFRPGFNIVGWFDNSAFSGNPVTSLMYASTIEVLYCRYDPVDYTLTFHETAEGAYIEPLVYHYGDTFELPQLVLEGHAFNGWCLEADLSDAPMTAIASDFWGDHTLYPKFTPHTYTISFKQDGFTLSEGTHMVTYGTSYTLPVPEKPGFVFTGYIWESENGLTPIANADGKSISPYTYTENIVLTATWEAVDYTLTFDKTTAGEYIEPIVYGYGDSFELKVLEKVGHTFEGWCTTEDLSDKPMTSIPKTFWGNYTLYAKFTPHTFTLTLEQSGFSLSQGTVKVKYGRSFTLPVPTREGYDFVAWLYTSDEDTIRLTNASGASLAAYTYTEDITLTAEWKKQTVTVTFVAEGTTGGESISVEYGSTLDALPTPVKPDHVFNNWYLDSAHTQLCPAGYRVTGNVTLYAKFIQSTAISNASDLLAIAVNPTVNYHLTGNIDLGGMAWQPIPEFSGTLDGKGFKIHNFTISGNGSELGFVNKNVGTIQNLTLSDFAFNITTSNVCFTAGVMAATNEGTIQNCRILDGVASFVFYYSAYDGTYHSYGGGIVGTNTGTLLNNEIAIDMSDSVSGNGHYYDDWTYVRLYVGSLTGNNTGSIDKCSINVNQQLFTGPASSDEIYVDQCAGGAVGINSGEITNTDCQINMNLESGESYAVHEYIGGFAYNNSGNISGCTVRGQLTSILYRVDMGGFIDENSGTISNCYADVVQSTLYSSADQALRNGGFVRRNSNTITNCYATGRIETAAINGAAAFAGWNEASGMISKCFSSCDVQVASATAVTGSFIAVAEAGSSAFKCYYDEAQTVTAAGIVTTPTNTNGTAAPLTDFYGSALLVDSLSWPTDVWYISDNALPILLWEKTT